MPENFFLRLLISVLSIAHMKVFNGNDKFFSPSFARFEPKKFLLSQIGLVNMPIHLRDCVDATGGSLVFIRCLVLSKRRLRYMHCCSMPRHPPYPLPVLFASKVMYMRLANDQHGSCGVIVLFRSVARYASSPILKCVMSCYGAVLFSSSLFCFMGVRRGSLIIKRLPQHGDFYLAAIYRTTTL